MLEASVVGAAERPYPVSLVEDRVLFSLAQRNKSLAGFVKYASRVKYGCAM